MRVRIRKSIPTSALLALATMTTAFAQPVETVLHNFSPLSPKGSGPLGALLRDSRENLYGTTWSGGRYGKGTVYRVSPAGVITELYSFSGGADGQYPNGLILDPSGNLYGTTCADGSTQGVAFKLDPTGHQTVLWTFIGGSDGGQPSGGLAVDSAGNLYGTTGRGGIPGSGFCELGWRGLQARYGRP
jgi:uncharacterized repeat protein (TIGR03803 family)